MLSEPGVPWREDREHGIALSHLTGPPGTFPGDTMHHEAGCQGNKEKAETAGDQLSVCGPAASLFSTREAKQGSLEGPGAWLPASSTSTFGTHFCPEEPARHRHTHGRGSCPKDQPQPMQVGSGRIIAGPKCFLPYSSAKITRPQKNKQTKKQTPTSQHSPRPNPKQPDNHSVKEQRAPNLTALDRKTREDFVQGVSGGNARTWSSRSELGTKRYST